MKEEGEAQDHLRQELSNDVQEIGCFMLVIGKVVLNLKTKLMRLEATNEKLIEAYHQGIDKEAVEQFQQMLDEDTDFT